MNIQSLLSRALALTAGVVLLAASALASADPPFQVIRLGYTTGAVSFSPAGEDDWVGATLNRPLTIGDRLWVDSGARTELQIGGSMLRLNGPAGVTVLNLEDNLTQLQLTQGAMNIRVRHLDPEQVVEVDTPNIALTLKQPGNYRVVVDTDGNATDVIVRSGRAEVYGDGASYVVDSRQSYRFYDTTLTDYEVFAAPRLDDFDRWASDRDRRYDASVSARYVSPDVIGYQDLDTYGSWSADPNYGNIWYPTRVTADWAPYRDGHWAWVDPWGWTWVDDAPWGFAVSHYGRWANIGNRWGWVPGPARTRAYYAPALVAFVGGNNFSVSVSSGNVGAVGWFPLGPREVYRPWYSASRRYVEQVNVTNTVVNATVINNFYNNNDAANVNYVNRRVPGAVVAVPTTAFVQSQAVQRAAVRMTPQMAASAPVAPLPAFAPTERSVRGPAAQSGNVPARVFERQVVARRAPAPAPASFAAQQPQLERQPGRPLDENARKEARAAPQARTAPATPAPQVKVIAQSQAAPPTVLPPPSTSPARTRDRPGLPAEGRAAADKAAPPQLAQPDAAPQPPQRGKGERGKASEDQRGQPAQATQAAPAEVATPGLQPRAGSPAQMRIQQQQPAGTPPTAAAPQAAPGATPLPETAQRRGMPRQPQEQARQAEQPQAQQAVQAEQQKREAQAAQQQQQQARQAEQQKARETQAAQQQQQQQARQAEQQKSREAQAAQQQQQQARQAEQQKAREAQAAQQQQQQQARQAEQQKAREAQAAQQQQARQAQQQQQQARQAEQQKARETQAAQQQQAQQAQQARQAEQQARQAQAQQQAQQAQQARQAEQQARQAQAQQQAQARQAQAEQARQAQAAQQAQQRAPRVEEQKGRGKSDEQTREEEAKKQKG